MAKLNGSLLWELSLSSSDAKSYVFGTMHAGSDEAYSFYDLAARYITNCTCFANEADLNEMNRGNAHLYLEGDQTLKTLIPEKKYIKIARIIKKSSSLELEALDRFKPIIIQNLMMESELMNNSRPPLDWQLKMLADQLGLRQTGVETVEDQIRIMNAIPLKIQLKTLLKSIKRLKESKRGFKKLIRHYKMADLQKMSEQSKKSLGSLRKLMLYDRNVKMADWIFTQSSIENTFVAIGAAHLGGNKGVLNLLRKKGFLLKAIHE